MADTAARLERLTVKQRKYVKNRVSGMEKEQAALAAGYSPATAKRGMTNVDRAPDVRAVFQDLVRRACPPAKLARVIAQGLDAKHTEFAKFEGKITDSRETIAWSERRAYAAMAAEFGGMVVKDDAEAPSWAVGTMHVTISPANVPSVRYPEPSANSQAAVMSDAPAIDVQSTSAVPSAPDVAAPEAFDPSI